MFAKTRDNPSRVTRSDSVMRPQTAFARVPCLRSCFETIGTTGSHFVAFMSVAHFCMYQYLISDNLLRTLIIVNLTNLLFRFGFYVSVTFSCDQKFLLVIRFCYFPQCFDTDQ